MARLNVFKPVMPFQGNPEAQPKSYENYLSYLRATNTVTNLADSVPYHWIDNPKLKPAAFQNGRVKALPEGMGWALKDIIEKGSPALADPQVSSSNSFYRPEGYMGGADGRMGMKGYGQTGGQIQLLAGLPEAQAQGVFAHEADHLISLPELINENIERGNAPMYMDRKNNTLIENDKYSDVLKAERKTNKGAVAGDTYDRSAHEIRANSSRANQRDFNRSGYDWGEGIDGPKPEEQVIMLNSKYMQNPKLVQQAASLFKKMAKTGKSALGAVGGLIDLKDTVDLMKDVGKYGVQSDAAFKKYLGADIKDEMI